MKSKIIHILSNSGTGGGQTHLLELLRHTNRAKFEVQIICNNKGHYLSDFYQLADKVHEVNFDKHPLTVILDIWGILKLEKPSLIHNHLLRSCFLGSIAGIFARVRSLNNLHGDIQDDQNQAWVKKKIYSSVNFLLALFGSSFICVSEFNKKRLIASGVTASSIVVIYNGVNEPDNGNRHNHQEDINIVSIARLHPAKGIETILRAAPSLSPYIKLHIIGDGPLENEYTRYILEHKIDNVLLHGFQPDVKPFLQMADIFMMSSNWEGLPIALVEAMSFGLPIIATNVGGIPEILHDSKGGRLFNPRDSGTLAKLLNEMSVDSAKRNEYGQYNYTFYKRNLTMTKMIESTENLYIAKYYTK
jgi:glycosyltransferase involved in cell wall biosynthesis